MRVVYRRSDGGWSFREATPKPSVDLQRVATTSTMYRSSQSGTKETKLRPGEHTTRGYVESDVEGNPPPAYYHEESVFSDSTSNPA